MLTTVQMLLPPQEEIYTRTLFNFRLIQAKSFFSRNHFRQQRVTVVTVVRLFRSIEFEG